MIFVKCSPEVDGYENPPINEAGWGFMTLETQKRNRFCFEDRCRVLRGNILFPSCGLLVMIRVGLADSTHILLFLGSLAFFLHSMVDQLCCEGV